MLNITFLIFEHLLVCQMSTTCGKQLCLKTCRYHSESGWQTLLEIVVEHYGIDVDQAAITIFVCLIPVILDACVKLWVCWFFLTLKVTFHDISLFYLFLSSDLKNTTVKYA